MTARTLDPLAAVAELRRCLAGRDLAAAERLITRPAVLAGLTELVVPARRERLERARKAPEWQAAVAEWQLEREAAGQARYACDVAALVAVLAEALRKTPAAA